MLLNTIGRLAWYMIFLIGKTLRIKQYGSDSDFYAGTGKSMIYATWHGRMVIPLYCRRNSDVSIIVSEHRDGELVTASVHASGNRTVRGSTTRGGAKALAQMIRLVKKGDKVCFTPDGPRGPRYTLQSGLVYVAAKTGVPVVPITGSARRAHYFKSWDAFLLPMPFSKAFLVIGEPYIVTGGTDEENIEFHRREIEQRLRELTQRADELAGADAP